MSAWWKKFSDWLHGRKRHKTYSVMAVIRQRAPLIAGDVTVTVDVADIYPPSDPVLTAGAVTTSTVALSWTQSTDATGVVRSGVAGYTLQRSADGVNYSTVYSGTSLSFTDAGLTAGTVYHYRVRAADVAGNASNWSTANATTTAVSGTIDYYIAPSPVGNNANAGTAASPWDITALNQYASLIAGKTVGLMDGTYRLTNFQTDYTQGQIVFPPAASGTAASPTVIKSVNPRGAVITQEPYAGAPSPWYDVSQLTCPPWRVQYGCNYMEFRDLFFDGTVTGSIGCYGSHILFEGNDFHDSDIGRLSGLTNYEDNHGFVTGGQVAYPVVDLTFRNNKFRHSYSSQSSIRYYESRKSGGHNCTGIGPMYYTSQVLIEYNYFEDCGGSTIYMKDGYSDVTIRYNYLAWGNEVLMGSTSQSTRAGLGYTWTTTRVHHNILNGVGWSTGRDNGVYQGNEERPTDLDFYNNTILIEPTTDFGGATSHGLSFVDNAGDVDWPFTLNLYNNIYAKRSGVTVSDCNQWTFLRTNPPATVLGTVSNNCYLPTVYVAYDADLPQSYSLAGWQELTGKDANSFTSSNPLFVNESGTTPADFQLQAGSPCLGAGRGGVNIGAWDGTVTQIGPDW